jgi:subtilisin family serine protease
MNRTRLAAILVFTLAFSTCLLVAETPLALAGSGSEEMTQAPALGHDDLSPAPSPPTVVTIDGADAPALWLVEFATPPTIEGGDLAAVRGDKDRFRQAVSQSGIVIEERYAFDTLWNGLSVRVDPTALAKLARMPEVESLYPVETLAVDPLPEAGVDLFNALAMTGANRAHDELGFDGTGIRVGIIDSGIDYHHPDLGGCFGSGCRVETGWDFVGNGYTGPPDDLEPGPDPDDCMGHGTHVAGIVGAEGTVTGVAPGVTLAAYRVFGCEGYTQSDVIIAAMERALADGMDVINISIGGARQWAQHPVAKAGTRLVNADVVVVASFGNDGSDGLYSGGGTAMGDKVIGTASVVNTHMMLPSFEAQGRDIAYDLMSLAADPPVAGTEPLVYLGRSCFGDPVLGNPAGKLALIERGSCTFREKALRAYYFGATGIVIHNNRYGTIFGSVGEPPFPLPVVGISQADGLYLRSLSSPWITWTDRLASGQIASGGLASSFSSFGLSPELKVKPDLAAPGGLIYSTLPLEKGGYAVYSGTSMASPHVVGAVALLLQAHPNTPAQVVRDILQNSADPIPNGEGYDLAIPELVHRQGAGLVDIPGAILATTRITPGKLSLGESEHGPVVRSLTIENGAATEVTFDLTHLPALATGGVIDPTFLTIEASVQFEPTSVTIPPHGTAFVSVTIVAPGAPQSAQYGGYLVFTPRDGGQPYRVPYAGFVGDYQAIRVLSDTPQGFPWLAERIGNGYSNRPLGASYTMQGNDIPYFLVHLDHPARKLRFEVFHTGTGDSWHRFWDADYVRRNRTYRGFWVFGWDGFTVHGQQSVEVPNGTYLVRLSVQKARGEDDDPDHWEHWDSPPVTIVRPVAAVRVSSGAALGDVGDRTRLPTTERARIAPR